MQRVVQIAIGAIVGAILLGGVFASLPVLAAPPAQTGATATIVADRLNVRSGPGTSYKVVGSAKNGEKLAVTGQSGQCSWLKVSRGGNDLGWVSGSKSFVKLSTTCAKIPAVAEPASAPASGAQGCAQITNKLGFDVKISVTRRDGWKDAFTVAKGADKHYCVDPGSYTATLSASGRPGAMSFLLAVKGGENYSIPLAMPEQ